MNLNGARVIVTGASRGIGEKIAQECAAKGARVAVVARSEEKLAKLAADIGGDAYAADFGDWRAVSPLVRRIEADGRVDVLVNNAGVDLTGRLTDLDERAIVQLYDVNLVAPVLLTRAVLPGMLERGRGHIVNVSSVAGTNALPGVAPYSSSKAGLSHFTAGLRADLKGTPVTTTLAEIGPVESAMMDSLRAHEPTRRALARLRKLRVTVDLDMDAVVAAIVDAIETDRRHVRLPKRNVVFPLLAEAPRRLTEWMLAGLK